MIKYFILSGLSLIVLNGCSTAARDTTKAGATTFISGQANPASVFCNKNQGILKLKQTKKGVVGFCYLSHGVICEEWAYFKGVCPIKKHKK